MKEQRDFTVYLDDIIEAIEKGVSFLFNPRLSLEQEFLMTAIRVLLLKNNKLAFLENINFEQKNM